MSIEFLSHEQVCQLTGARTKAGQMAILARNGIRHTIKLSGWPCVTTAAVIGSEPEAKAIEKVTWQSRKVG